MSPVRTLSTNRVFSAPPTWSVEENGKCEELPVTAYDGVLYSYWSPSVKDRLKILFGKKIRLAIFSTVQPPVALDTNI
jgi:hypothetical protein